MEISSDSLVHWFMTIKPEKRAGASDCRWTPAPSLHSFCLFDCFGRTRVRTQGLALARQSTLPLESHASPFYVSFSVFVWGQTVDPSTYDFPYNWDYSVPYHTRLVG